LIELLKCQFGEFLPIIGADNEYYYRNKLEYTFSDRRWLTDLDAPKEEGGPTDTNGLGFHLPGMFDKILDIEHCYLQKIHQIIYAWQSKNTLLRMVLNSLTLETMKAFLRNLIIRTSSTGDLMVIVVFRYDDLDIADFYRPLLINFQRLPHLCM